MWRRVRGTPPPPLGGFIPYAKGHYAVGVGGKRSSSTVNFKKKLKQNRHLAEGSTRYKKSLLRPIDVKFTRTFRTFHSQVSAYILR